MQGWEAKVALHMEHITQGFTVTCRRQNKYGKHWGLYLF